MSLRTWLWLGTALNAIIFLPASFMAYNAVAFATANTDSGAVMAVALLFLALPIFCLLAPFAAWRIHGKRYEDRNAALMMGAPLVYAAFLVMFLLNN
jgi:hypothetical protein